MGGALFSVKILSLTVCSFHRSDANILKDLNFFLSVRSSQVFKLNNRRRLNKIDLQVMNRRSKYFSDLKATTLFFTLQVWYLLYQQELFFLNLKNRLTCNYEITDTYYFLFIPEDTIMIVKVHSFKKKNSSISKGIIWLLNSINFSEIVEVLTFTIQVLLGGGQFSLVLDRYLEIIILSSLRLTHEVPCCTKTNE